MGFFDGLIGGLIGGGDEQEVHSSQSTTVNVDVQPQIGVGVDVDVDTKPIAEAIADATEEGQADIAAVVAAGNQQTQALAGALTGAFGALSEQLSQTVLLVVVIGGVAWVLMR